MRDITSNPNFSMLQHTVDHATLPDFVKEASLDQLGLESEIPTAAYAYRQGVKQALPCHNKSACFVSRLYFEAQRHELDSKLAADVEAKLAGFERMHDIDPELIAPAVNSIRASQLVPLSAAKMASTAAMTYAREPNRWTADQLVTVARELKTAGAENQFVSDWVFDRPLKNAGRQIRAIANQYANEKLAELANQAGNTPARQLPELMPKLAGLLNAVLKSNQSTQRKLAGLEYLDDVPVRIGRFDVPVAKLLPHLPKIAALTNLPVVHQHIRIPTDRWEQVIEQSPPAMQQKILDHIQLV